LETVVDSVERGAKQSQRETEVEVRTIKKETEQALRQLNKDVDSRIQKALDNPLAK
jgi:hypothetical protein